MRAVAPAACDPADFTAAQGRSRATITDFAAGMVDEGLYFSADLAGSYLVAESISLGSSTEATAVYCVFDARHRAGTQSDPMGCRPSSTTRSSASDTSTRCSWKSGTWRVGRAAADSNVSAREVCVRPPRSCSSLRRALLLVRDRCSPTEAGGDDSPGDTGGAAQISTWVIGAVNGGVGRPAGTTLVLLGRSSMGRRPRRGLRIRSSSIRQTGQAAIIYFRRCDTTYQYVYVGPHTPERHRRGRIPEGPRTGAEA